MPEHPRASGIGKSRSGRSSGTQVIEALPHVVWSMRRDGSIVYCNRQWRACTGSEVPASFSAALAEAVHPDDANQTVAAAAHAFASGTSWFRETRFRSSAGGYSPHLLRLAPIHAASGLVTEWIASAVELPPHEEPPQAAEMHGRIASLTHELNNPTNLIPLSAPLIREAWRDALPILDEHYREHGDFAFMGTDYLTAKAQVEELFRNIDEGVERIQRITKDIARLR
jgi:hypothetical protein